MTSIVATTRAVVALACLSACGGRSSSQLGAERAQGGAGSAQSTAVDPDLPPLLRGCPCPHDGDEGFVELTSSESDTLRLTQDLLGNVHPRESCPNDPTPPVLAIVEPSCPSLSLIFNARTREGVDVEFLAYGGYAELSRNFAPILGNIRYGKVQDAASDRALSGEFEFIPSADAGVGDVTLRGTFAVCTEVRDVASRPCRDLPQGDAGTAP